MSPGSSSALLKTWAVELLGGGNDPKPNQMGGVLQPAHCPPLAATRVRAPGLPPSETTRMAVTETFLPSRLCRQGSGLCLQ